VQHNFKIARAEILVNTYHGLCSFVLNVAERATVIADLHGVRDNPLVTTPVRSCCTPLCSHEDNRADGSKTDLQQKFTKPDLKIIIIYGVSFRSEMFTSYISIILKH